MTTRGKKQGKAGSARENRKRRGYTQKECTSWQCRVCREMYEPSVPYCLSCYHALYYYCYVNAELFVEKDLAYIDIYYQDSPPASEGEEEPEEQIQHPDLNWIHSLLE